MELLAPVGTIQSLKSAVIAGADAVYFGLGELNARAKSLDFDRTNAKEWIDYCHLFGVKVYITINVNVYDSELEKAMSLVRVAYQSNADALIVSDLGLITLIRKEFPDFCIHVSTQAGIKNKSASDFYKKLGVTRVVFARESSLKEIASVSGVEKEVFIHGALCVAFSGNCLLSCYVGGKSGNRGQCRQPCRQLYEVRDQNGKQLLDGYCLSTKDICLADYLQELENAGVDSLKIEGRLKSPEYVFAVTSYYRKLLDGVKSSKKDILTAFNRGSFTPAYFRGKNVIYTKTSSHIGYPAGKILKLEKKNGFSFATIDCKLQKGDGLKILRNGFEVGGSDVTSCVKSGDRYVIPVSNGVRVGDELCLTRSTELTNEIQAQTRKISVDISLKFGQRAYLSARSGDVGIEIYGDEPLNNRDMSYDEIYAQMSKTGNTDFVLRSLEFVGKGYLPKSRLNAMRNEGLEKLKNAIIRSYSVERCKPTAFATLGVNEKISGTIIESDNLNISNQFDALVYYPNVISCEEFSKAGDFCRKIGKPLFLKFPFLIGEDEQNEYIKFAFENGFGVYADNVSVVELARKYRVRYIAGIGLNIANKITASGYSDARAIISSIETGSHGLGENNFVYSFGRISLMYFEHCPNEVVSGQSCAKCQNKQRKLYYNHINSFELVARRTKYRCYYTLYSDKILDYRSIPNKYICLIEYNSDLSKCSEIIGE